MTDLLMWVGGKAQEGCSVEGRGVEDQGGAAGAHTKQGLQMSNLSGVDQQAAEV